MRISSSQLRQIIAEEYAAHQQRQRLAEGTARNPIKLDQIDLRNMIMQEARNLNGNQRRLQETVRLDASSLRRIIMEEARKLDR